MQQLQTEKWKYLRLKLRQKYLDQIYETNASQTFIETSYAMILGLLGPFFSGLNPPDKWLSNQLIKYITNGFFFLSSNR